MDPATLNLGLQAIGLILDQLRAYQSGSLSAEQATQLFQAACDQLTSAIDTFERS